MTIIGTSAQHAWGGDERSWPAPPTSLPPRQSPPRQDENSEQAGGRGKGQMLPGAARTGIVKGGGGPHHNIKSAENKSFESLNLPFPPGPGVQMQQHPAVGIAFAGGGGGAGAASGGPLAAPAPPPLALARSSSSSSCSSSTSTASGGGGCTHHQAMIPPLQHPSGAPSQSGHQQQATATTTTRKNWDIFEHAEELAQVFPTLRQSDIKEALRIKGGDVNAASEYLMPMVVGSPQTRGVAPRPPGPPNQSPPDLPPLPTSTSAAKSQNLQSGSGYELQQPPPPPSTSPIRSRVTARTVVQHPTATAHLPDNDVPVWGSPWEQDVWEQPPPPPPEDELPTPGGALHQLHVVGHQPPPPSTAVPPRRTSSVMNSPGILSAAPDPALASTASANVAPGGTTGTTVNLDHISRRQQVHPSSSSSSSTSTSGGPPPQHRYNHASETGATATARASTSASSSKGPPPTSSPGSAGVTPTRTPTQVGTTSFAASSSSSSSSRAAPLVGTAWNKLSALDHPHEIHADVRDGDGLREDHFSQTVAVSARAFFNGGTSTAEGEGDAGPRAALEHVAAPRQQPVQNPWNKMEQNLPAATLGKQGGVASATSKKGGVNYVNNPVPNVLKGGPTTISTQQPAGKIQIVPAGEDPPQPSSSTTTPPSSDEERQTQSQTTTTTSLTPAAGAQEEEQGVVLPAPPGNEAQAQQGQQGRGPRGGSSATSAAPQHTATSSTALQLQLRQQEDDQHRHLPHTASAPPPAMMTHLATMSASSSASSTASASASSPASSPGIVPQQIQPIPVGTTTTTTTTSKLSAAAAPWPAYNLGISGVRPPPPLTGIVPAPSIAPSPCQFVLELIVPDQDDRDQIGRILAQLEKLLLDPAAKLAGEKITLYGGSVNGFSLKKGDIDCSLLTPVVYKQREQQLQKLLQFEQILKENGYTEVETVSGAKIPIVKARSPEGRDVDISINNPIPIRNSHLLRTYATCPLARDLGCLVKYWAHQRGLVDAQHGCLSAYSWVILVIFFLQQKQILPCLQEGVKAYEVHVEGFNCSFDEWWDWDSSVERQQHHELFEYSRSVLDRYLIQFFHWLRNFDHTKQLISIAKRKAILDVEMRLAEFGKQQWAHSKYLLIEDPLESGRILATNKTGHDKIIKELDRAIKEIGIGTIDSSSNKIITPNCSDGTDSTNSGNEAARGPRVSGVVVGSADACGLVEVESLTPSKRGAGPDQLVAPLSLFESVSPERNANGLAAGAMNYSLDQHQHHGLTTYNHGAPAGAGAAPPFMGGGPTAGVVGAVGATGPGGGVVGAGGGKGVFAGYPGASGAPPPGAHHLAAAAPFGYPGGHHPGHHTQQLAAAAAATYWQMGAAATGLHQNLFHQPGAVPGTTVVGAGLGGAPGAGVSSLAAAGAGGGLVPAGSTSVGSTGGGGGANGHGASNNSSTAAASQSLTREASIASSSAGGNIASGGAAGSLPLHHHHLLQNVGSGAAGSAGGGSGGAAGATSSSTTASARESLSQAAGCSPHGAGGDRSGSGDGTGASGSNSNATFTSTNGPGGGAAGGAPAQHISSTSTQSASNSKAQTTRTSSSSGGPGLAGAGAAGPPPRSSSSPGNSAVSPHAQGATQRGGQQLPLPAAAGTTSTAGASGATSSSAASTLLLQGTSSSSSSSQQQAQAQQQAAGAPLQLPPAQQHPQQHQAAGAPGPSTTSTATQQSSQTGSPGPQMNQVGGPPQIATAAAIQQQQLAAAATAAANGATALAGSPLLSPFGPLFFDHNIVPPGGINAELASAHLAAAEQAAVDAAVAAGGAAGQGPGKGQTPGEQNALGIIKGQSPAPGDHHRGSAAGPGGPLNLSPVNPNAGAASAWAPLFMNPFAGAIPGAIHPGKSGPLPMLPHHPAGFPHHPAIPPHMANNPVYQQALQRNMHNLTQQYYAQMFANPPGHQYHVPGPGPGGKQGPVQAGKKGAFGGKGSGLFV